MSNVIRINPDETFEEWVERVRKYEYGFALQRIATGEDVSKVMEDMAKRMAQKIMHPVYKAIKDSSVISIDIEESRKRYEENYLHKVAPAADHVLDD
jgi:glutamyl-tRNA reductase